MSKLICFDHYPGFKPAITAYNETALAHVWQPFCSFLWLQIYQEDMMRSLLQNSLHVFRAISGTATDLGWTHFFQFVTGSFSMIANTISYLKVLCCFVLFFSSCKLQGWLLISSRQIAMYHIFNTLYLQCCLPDLCRSLQLYFAPRFVVLPEILTRWATAHLQQAMFQQGGKVKTLNIKKLCMIWKRPFIWNLRIKIKSQATPDV